MILTINNIKRSFSIFGCSKVLFYGSTFIQRKEFLLKLINPSKNVVFYNKIDVYEYLNEYKKIIFYLSNTLPQDLTVLNYFKFLGRIYKTIHSIDAVIDYTKLNNYLKVRIEKLDHFIQCRVRFASILLNHSPIVFIEENINLLDEFNKKLLNNILHSRIEQKHIVFITVNSIEDLKFLVDEKSITINLDDT